MAKVADKYFITDAWKIIEEGFNPEYSRVAEAVFSISNETMGVRGCFDEGGSIDSLRGMYMNGVFEVDGTLPKSYKGIIDKTHFMIPCADWLGLSIELDGETLDLGKCAFEKFRRELDLRTGTLTRSFVWKTATGKSLKLTFIRFADMTDRERAYQRILFEPENFTGAIRFSAGLSFDVIHEGYHKKFWGTTREEADGSSVMLESGTLVSKQEVFAGMRLFIDGKPAHAETVKEEKSARLQCSIILEKGRRTVIDKTVVMLFNGETGSQLWDSGRTALENAAGSSFEKALARQKAFWEDLWRTSDIILEPSTSGEAQSVAEEQQGVRFCIFQMTQTYRGGNPRHNIGAKGLTGEAYNGHAFWDTEACCLPFYLFTNPDAARSLLIYRYNTLAEAKNRARMLDCEGACYPIATLNGEEACSLWQHASLQFQPSTAVAFGIWHYVHVIGDTQFLFDYGAEMLLEIARFLKSRAAQNPHTGQYGYYGVMGPDEFHMMVNNNAYTNYMSKRSLEYAIETLKTMKTAVPEQYAKLAQKTGLTDNEIDTWQNYADNMYIPMDDKGLIEQHEGYFNLPHTDIHSIPVEEFPLYNHWSYDRIYRTDMIKQPDVLMLLYLYNSSFSDEVKRINYEFYEPRTIHESSLSPAIHSILACELGRMDEAIAFFGHATRLDLDNYNRNTREGLHTTSIAAAWINIVYGFGGLRSDGEGLNFTPHLPARWKSVSFSVHYQRRLLRVVVMQDKTGITLVDGEPADIRVYGATYRLVGGSELEIPSR